MKFLPGFGLFVFGVCSSLYAAADSSPFATSNRTVMIRSLGLPTADDARLLQRGEYSAVMTAEHTSHFFIDDEGNEQAFLDGETTGFSVKMHYGLGANWNVGLELPYISHQSGFLDSFVEGWHKTFGLPNGRREEFARDQLQFSVQTPQADITLNHGSSGLGDVAVFAVRKLAQTKSALWSAQLRVEAPSGEHSKLLGSDSWDVALGVHAFAKNAEGVSFNGNIGVVIPGDSKLLPELQKDAVAYATATVGWPLYADWLTLKIQLEGHSAFYETDIKALGRESLQLSFGAGIRLSERWHLNLGMSEDIAPQTAPDFTLLASLLYRQ